MALFYFHPQNTVAKKLAEMTREHGFMYTSRAELEFKIQRLLADAGYHIYPTFYSIIASLSDTIKKHIPLNPDHPLDLHAIKLEKNKNCAWYYFKINNGPDHFVLGYCSSGAQSPISLTSAQMAQKGIINASHIPTATS